MTVAKPTRTLIVENGDFSPATIDPDSFGLMADVPKTEWTAELHWQTADAVLRGESHLAYLLNSGLRLWVTKHAESLEEGISKARTHKRPAPCQQRCQGQAFLSSRFWQDHGKGRASTRTLLEQQLPAKRFGNHPRKGEAQS
ncbi:hypothetical protein EDM55_04925 [Brevibacillus centrosporus]|nr:hypothetical protein EDM55_04925 [Brevibacillus centrosporus]